MLFREGRGKGFLCTEKGYYIPLIYWAEVPGSGGKTPPGKNLHINCYLSVRGSSEKNSYI